MEPGSSLTPGVVYIAFADHVACINGTAVRYMAPSPNGGHSVGFVTPGWLVTTGVLDGVGVYAMGLSGTLCAAGFYALNGQCVVTPAGTYAGPWATEPTRCPPNTAGSTLGAVDFHSGCTPCATDGVIMIADSWGQTACSSPCESGLAWSSADLKCVGRCNASLGLYRQDENVGGSCVRCPPGTGSDSGVGLVSCDPCAPGTFYNGAVCARCPEGTSTLWLGKPHT